MMYHVTACPLQTGIELQCQGQMDEKSDCGIFTHTHTHASGVLEVPKQKDAYTCICIDWQSYLMTSYTILSLDTG